MTQRLDDMALFVEVVRANSFRRAADAMDMPSSTLSRRIAALERSIGLRLMHRTTRRLELTEAGELYFERCRRIVEEARLAHEQLGGMLDKPSGVLRVSLPVDFATVYLAPVIAEFAARHPELGFEFDLTPRRSDLVAEPFDLAIRMGVQPPSAMIARLLTRIPRRLFASPRYLARRGIPEQPQDLSRHECLRMGTPQEGRHWTLHRAAERAELPLSGRFAANNMGLLRELALHDQGIAMLSEAPVRDDLAQGRLVRVLSAWEAAPVPVFALTESRLLPAKTQRFIEYLRDAFGRS